MRAWIVYAGAAAALAACSGGNEADDNQDLNRSLTAQNIVANDVTAIDAVTGDAANMAADVDFTEELANELGPVDGGGSESTPRPRRSTREPAGDSRPAARAPDSAPANEAAANAAE